MPPELWQGTGPLWRQITLTEKFSVNGCCFHLRNNIFFEERWPQISAAPRTLKIRAASLKRENTVLKVLGNYFSSCCFLWMIYSSTLNNCFIFWSNLWLCYIFTHFKQERERSLKHFVQYLSPWFRIWMWFLCNVACKYIEYVCSAYVDQKKAIDLYFVAS